MFLRWVWPKAVSTLHRLGVLGTARGAVLVTALSLLASGAGASGRPGIVCNDSFTKPVVRVAPVRCVILPPRASFSEGVNLVGLSWRSWGGPSATGTGFERGFHLPYSHIPAAVVAYRLVTCSDGSRLYTRLRVISNYGGGGAVRAQGCLGG
jgi:hypothetical protein